MANVVHTSRIQITRDRGPIRQAMIEGFAEPVFYGVHGGIQKFYKVDPVEEHAATLDHIVGAVSAWMMGTFASVLATKKIRTHTDRFRADVEGDIEDVVGVLKITVIRVKYVLKITPEEEGAARWALENYVALCPAAMSVSDCIRLDHTLELDVEE